jgi:hypothetical protein
MKIPKEIMEDVATYGILLVSWVPLMNALNGNVAETAVAGFGVFLIAKKIVKKVL